MQIVRLAGTTLDVSRFIFGTASLFNAGNSAKRESVIEAAIDNGFTHFDTAPYYGFGLAERDLAGPLRRYPRVTVTTKVGIYSPGGENHGALSVFLRKAAGRAIKAFSRPTIDFAVARAEGALEGSLRRLGRDMIDLYTLHEPEIDLLNTEEWARWLEDARRAGKIRHFGLALTADKLEPFLAAQTPLAEVVQMADSLRGREADMLTQYGRALQITYAYVSAERAVEPAVSVSAVLKQALMRNTDGAIIVSTTRPERTAQYARLLEPTA